jgi:hypothetical protein
MTNRLYSAVKTCTGLWMIGSFILGNIAYPAQKPPALAQPAAGLSSATMKFPTDLSALASKMEEVLSFVKSPVLREALLASLQASIPEAIAQADGLAEQIAFLNQEIVRQERELAHAEEAAREDLADSSTPLTPCKREMERSYCHVVDQYYASLAANMANRAFLEALECYQLEGLR